MSDEVRKNLDLFLLKQCAVLLHEIVQLLHEYSDRCNCPYCGSSKLSRRAKKKEDIRKGAAFYCKHCEGQFIVAEQDEVVSKIVDVILIMGDAGVPLPPKRDT